MKYCKGLTTNRKSCKRQIKNDENYCYQHANKLKDFTAKDYYACHFTSYENLIKILKIKKLISIYESENDILNTNFGLEGDDLYNKSIFVSTIFPYLSKDILKDKEVIKHTFNPSDVDKVYLIFKSNILKKSNHWCNKWNFGEIDENCLLYDKKQSLSENLNLWNCRMKNKIDLFINNQKLLEQGKMPNMKDIGLSLIFGIPENEAVFYESISLDDLECIYIDPESFTKKQMKIMNLYPEYNWVTTNPFE